VDTTGSLICRVLLACWVLAGCATANPPVTSVATNEGSCRQSVSDERARQLVQQCMRVSPATHPPCNASNSCALIEDEIRRGCGMLGKDAPGFCGASHQAN
jgi:hypothetical protein